MGKTKGAASRLQIRLLGPFRVAVHGVAIDRARWKRRKSALLVKLLALQPLHQLHREEIQDWLWPELDAMAASRYLYTILYDVRRILEPRLTSGAASRFLVTTGRIIELRAP